MSGGALKANSPDPSKNGKLKFNGKTADEVKAKQADNAKAAEA